MPRVHFLNEAVTIDAPKGKTLLQVAREADVNLFKGFFKAYNCGGRGRCLGAGCKVWAIERDKGAVKHAKPPFFKQWLWRLHGAQVMACRATVEGDCEVRTQPGALEFSENAVWEPDPRHYRWKDRLLVEQKKKKKKAAPAKKPAPKAKVDPQAPDDVTQKPTAEATPAAKDIVAGDREVERKIDTAAARATAEAVGMAPPDDTAPSAASAEPEPEAAPAPAAAAPVSTEPIEVVPPSPPPVHDAGATIEPSSTMPATEVPPADTEPGRPDGEHPRPKRSKPSETDAGWED